MTTYPSINVEFHSMASAINITVVDPKPEAQAQLRGAQTLFESIASTCTRFDPQSPLMVANASSHEWHTAPALLIDVVKEAHAAYLRTEGRFDPRVLGDLSRHGYGKSRDFSNRPEIATASSAQVTVDRAPWNPQFSGNELLIGPDPIDLGGIGKGLAVRWAKDILMNSGAGFLINAGGDIAASGHNAAGNPWTIGIENPWDFAGDPVVVVKGAPALATSSIRLRSWKEGGQTRHHLIDPRTGEPGGAGLVSVSVIGEDTAWAEVWTKSLFLEGMGIEALANEFDIAAIWVTSEGNVGFSKAAREFITWSVSRATRK